MKYIKIIFTIIVFYFFNSCGLKEVSYRNYQFYIEPTSQIIEVKVRELLKNFNLKIQKQVFNEVSSYDEANSYIKVIKGLEKRDGKIGWGEWKKRIQTDTPVSYLMLQSPQKEIYYSGSIELDYDFSIQTLSSSDPAIQKQFDVLFYHESGHVIGLEHDDNPRSIMYPVINSSDKDFESFFEQARQILNSDD